MSLLGIRTVPLDSDKIETIIKRNIRLQKDSINLKFFNLIFFPHFSYKLLLSKIKNFQV